MKVKTNPKKPELREPLVVLHGWGMNSEVWNAINPLLEERFDVTYIDLPGHGVCKNIKANSLADMVKQIISALNHLEKRTHLLGWSLGGMAAQSIAHAVPEKIKTLSLVASTPRFSQSQHDPIWRHAMSEAVLAQFSDNLCKDIEGTIKRFISLQFMGSKTESSTLTSPSNGSSNIKNIQRNLIQDVLSSMPSLDALKTGLDILTHADLRHNSSNINHIPQHWILGAKDRLVPIAVADDLKVLNPNSRITIFQEAGHAPFMTHPQQFVQAVTDFIYTN